MILELPRPNAQELAPYNKSDYFMRLFETIDYKKKYNISQTQFSNWIHNNYTSILLEGKSINIQQQKKLG
jgi:hypothetical protein